MSKLNAAVFGLGSMGYGIASSLLRAGVDVWGYDVAEQPVQRLRTEGGQSGAVAEIAAQLDAVVVVVLNGEQLREVLFGDDGIAPHLRAGAVVIACPTVPPELAREMEQQCRQGKVHYLDAPISGGSVKAANGQLTIMASGTAAAFAAAAPFLDATAEKVFELGDSAGAGSAMKAVNQLLAGVHIATMAEAITFGITQGVTAEKFLEVIPDCAGSSWMLENRAPHIVAGDYTPHSAINIWPKDLGIVLEIARSAGFDAPITQAALAQYRKAVEDELGREDDAAVAKVYAKQAGISLPADQS